MAEGNLRDQETDCSQECMSMVGNSLSGANDEKGERELLTVIEVERYIVDPIFVQQIHLENENVYDAYDITLSNKGNKRKMVLLPKFNYLVQKRKIFPGSKLMVKKVTFRQDKTGVDGRVIQVIQDLAVMPQDERVNLKHLQRLPWHGDYHAKDTQLEKRPLASVREYYVDLWCDADVVKTSDDVQVERSRSLNITSSDLYSLREVANNWNRVKAAKPRLLLRIMKRAKIFSYAKACTKDKWPFQLHLTVGDETGCCVAVFWNAMAIRFVQSVQEGDVILLRNFTVKPHFEMPDLPTECVANLPSFAVDLNVNMHHPKAEVKLVDPAALDSLNDVNLPLPVSNFVSRVQLSCFPDGYVCDVAGVVTFVGSIKREKMKGKAGLDQFWIRRWIQLKDGTKNLPIIVKWYRGVQKTEFEELTVGSFFVCRNMVVMHGLSQLKSSRQMRYVYVTSTRNTQVYSHAAKDPVQYPFPLDAVLVSAQHFAASYSAGLTDQNDIHNMLFTFPPTPTSLDAFRSSFENLEMTMSDGWQKFVELLRYRESSGLAVQAKLVGIAFHRGHLVLRKSKRRQGQERQPQASGSSNIDAHATALGVNPMLADTEMDIIHSSFFVLKWRGLNTNVELISVREVHLASCPENPTLPMFLSGELDALPGTCSVPIGEIAVDRILSWPWNVSSTTRFFVALDVYCMDGEKVLFGINRAFPLPDA